MAPDVIPLTVEKVSVAERPKTKVVLAIEARCQVRAPLVVGENEARALVQRGGTAKTVGQETLRPT
eukprot:3705223-Lingulodinium_polyedra.AAC.1